MERSSDTAFNGIPGQYPGYSLPNIRYPIQIPPLPPQNNVPPGLATLYAACRRIYPSQPNPLQVTAVVKYWLGGPDPLDYISMYANPGDLAENIPPHWHYISFGLSDLHGDGRVHEVTPSDNPSGYGFELTFRLKREADEISPPTWPAAVMQALAKYVFQSENVLCNGDHVSWHCSLDNTESRIQHMLMTEDPQLKTTITRFGSVSFIQIVGVCLEELQAAQQWNGPGIIELMRSVDGAGGEYLITNMRRGETIFEIDPEIREAVDDGIATEGSNLSGVSAKCSWSDKYPKSNWKNHTNGNYDSEDGSSDNNIGIDNDDIQNKLNGKPLSPTTNKTSSSRSSRSSSMSVSHDHNTSNSRMSYASETGAPEPGELIQTKYLKELNIMLNQEAGSLLPLVLRGRLKHGRHFTFKNVAGDIAITFTTESVSGSFVTSEQPYAVHGPWLQILIKDDFISEMISELNDISEIDLPHTFEFNRIKLSITILPEEIAQ